MFYSNSVSVFKSNFKTEDLISLYRDIKSSDICPEVWDKQIRFWSGLIKKSGVQTNAVEFSVEKLSQCWTYHEVIPPIQPAIDYLVEKGTLKSKEEVVAKRSFTSSIASKFFGFFRNPSRPKSDIYVFVDNLREATKGLIAEIESGAAFSTDVVLTNEEIKNKLSLDADFDLYRAELSQTKGIKSYEDGLYFQCGRYSDLHKDIVTAIINSKLVLRNIELKLEQIKVEIKKECENAKTYLIQKRKTHALNCIKRKRMLETQENRMNGMYQNLSQILNQLAENELNKTISADIDHINKTAKKMQQLDPDDIQTIMDDLEEQMVKSNELADAFTVNTNQIDDDEIEAELQEMMSSENNPQEQVKTIGKFKYQLAS